jgi:hypothetical protein
MTDISITRGDDRDYDITVTTDVGNAWDITGAELRFAARYSGSIHTFIDKVSTASGEIDITNAAGGLALLHLDPADTLKLPLKTVNLQYDLQLTESSGPVTTIVSGTLTVAPDVAA